MGIESIGNDAFDAVYEANVDKVYRIALYYSEDPHAAEDITQTVFMLLYTNIENINVDRIGAWIKTTTKHMALNHRKHMKYEVDFPMEEIEDIADIADSVSYVESVETTFINQCSNEVRRELIESIYEELYSKNSRWYEALTVSYILEKPQDEVAKKMGISIGALRIMLHRARNWIRKKYQEQLDHLDER